CTLPRRPPYTGSEPRRADLFPERKIPGCGEERMKVPSGSFIMIGLLFAAGLMAQHGGYLNESRNPAIGNPQAIAAGAKLWATSCAGCHAPDGSGGRGPNLVRRALWHPLSDETMHQTIREGVPGTDMPPSHLSDDETWNLVAFVKALTGPASEN